MTPLIIVKLDNNNQIEIDGFGPNTAMGVIGDVLNGKYTAANGNVVSIEVVTEYGRRFVQ